METNNCRLVTDVLYGIAVGDALGFPVQFQSRSERKIRPIVNMGSCLDTTGKSQFLLDEQIGEWSDDTSLTLCLAESLLNGFDLNDQAEKFVAWNFDGYLSARDEAFDQGIQTIEALTELRQFLIDKDYEKLENLANDDDEYTNGNGSLMRILPLVLYIYGMDIRKQYELVRKSCALTHPHIRAALCCLYYLRMAEHIIDGKDKFTAYRTARTETLQLMKELDCPESEYEALNRLLYIAIEDLTEDDIISGYYVVESLETCIWCLLTNDSYKEAVLKVVNLGDDTDTNAAITGGLAALLYGFESIPQEWIAALKKPELFTSLIDKYSNLNESIV